MRRIQFLRDFRGFTGGHLKYADYILHSIQHPDFEASLYLTPESIEYPDLDWKKFSVVDRLWDPYAADVLFIAGLDWGWVPVDLPSSTPVINLVQGVRHALPTDPRYKFLTRRAIRVCVSQSVQQRLCDTGDVNGPVFCIEAGISLPGRMAEGLAPSRDVFLDGIKDRALAEELCRRLRRSGLSFQVNMERVPRSQYLRSMSEARFALLLPARLEGFYLPGLEAMAMGVIPIVPDCAGNRSYLVDGENGMMPTYDVEAIWSALIRVKDTAAGELRTMRDQALKTSIRFSLEKEGRRYRTLVLDQLDSLWGHR